jgi:hypothetical protein
MIHSILVVSREGISTEETHMIETWKKSILKYMDSVLLGSANRREDIYFIIMYIVYVVSSRIRKVITGSSHKT